MNALVYVDHRPGHSLGQKSDEDLQCSPRSWLDDFMQPFSWRSSLVRALDFLNKLFLCNKDYFSTPIKASLYILFNFSSCWSDDARWVNFFPQTPSWDRYCNCTQMRWSVQHQPILIDVLLTCSLLPWFITSYIILVWSVEYFIQKLLVTFTAYLK